MLEVIEKLLVLQDRDRNLIRTEAELESIEPEKQMALRKCDASLKALEEAKLKVNEIESKRKERELEVQAFNEKIAKYSNQQLETKKNEEYQALTREIKGCNEKIGDIETDILMLMDEAEAAATALKESQADADKVKGFVESQVADLDERQKNLDDRLDELDEERDKLAAEIDETSLRKYERLLKLRGDNIVVGIEHSACGGCHVKVPAQVILSCKQEEELTGCPHCSRLLYFTRDMEMEAAPDAGPGNQF
jgi:uncharacterized protein